jgi:arginine deiminase
MGATVLALRAPCARGQRRHAPALESAGVDVVTYAGDHISRLGDGGPTCLTRPILRTVP